MNNPYHEILAEARNYAYLAKTGQLTYDEAKAKCIPLLDILNKRGAEIAKKYKKRFKAISFSGLVR